MDEQTALNFLSEQYGDPDAPPTQEKQFNTEKDALDFLGTPSATTGGEATYPPPPPWINEPTPAPPPPWINEPTPVKMEKPSWMERHPNIYAGLMTPVGTAKALSKISYAKYFYPEEREKFSNVEFGGEGWWAAKTPEQAQTRKLLYDLLDLEALIGGERVIRGIKPFIGKIPGLRSLVREGKVAVPAKAAEKATVAAEKEAVMPKSPEELRELAKKGPVDVYGKPNPTLGMEPQDIPRGLVRDRRSEAMTVAEQAAASDIKTAAADKAMTKTVNDIMNRSKRDLWDQSEADAITKFTEVLKSYKPARAAQEAIYSAERSKRIKAATAVGKKVPGEAGYYAQLGKLSGKMEQVQVESLRNALSQKEVDQLFTVIRKSANVQGFDEIVAQRGLAKALAGDVPTNSELLTLRQVFPKETIDAMLSNRELFRKIAESGMQLANVPRSIMASMDFSAPFRQGIYMAPSHPVRFAQSFFKMFKQYGSETAHKAVMDAVRSKPTFKLGQESGLALTDVGEFLANREEAFMSQWAEKIPIIGRQVRGSGRAYTGFLNKMRMDVFDDLITKAERAGLNPYENPQLSKAIAKFVNAGTGRGSLGALEESATTLNTFFFSPRLMASRLTLLNPWTYINPKTPAFVRKEALKSTIAFASAIGTVLGLAKMSGAEVGTDIRSADFGKIKIGNTRLDIMGGFGQYIRAAGQLLSSKFVSSTTGKEYTYGEGYRPTTKKDIVGRQVRYKLAPAASFVWDMLGGLDENGVPVSVPKEVAERFIPMVLQDIYDIMEDDPSMLPLSIPAAFGVGLQTYGGKKQMREAKKKRLLAKKKSKK